MNAILGRKIGMTQIYSEDGRVIPVTVLEAGPCPIVAVRTLEKHGYEAVQIAYGLIREKLVSKPVAGQFKKAGVPARRILTEVPAFDGAAVGGEVKVDRFQVGTAVDVIGTSKGRGFAGTIKRHHFNRGPETHGSMNVRAPGSIGASAYPSRVVKGMRSSGHMGDARITVKGLTIARVDAENNLLMVRGAVPGANGSVVIVKKAAQRQKKK